MRLFTSSSFCFWTELLPVLCQRSVWEESERLTRRVCHCQRCHCHCVCVCVCETGAEGLDEGQTSHSQQTQQNIWARPSRVSGRQRAGTQAVTESSVQHPEQPEELLQQHIGNTTDCVSSWTSHDLKVFVGSKAAGGVRAFSKAAAAQQLWRHRGLRKQSETARERKVEFLSEEEEEEEEARAVSSEVVNLFRLQPPLDLHHRSPPPPPPPPPPPAADSGECLTVTLMP